MVTRKPGVSVTRFCVFAFLAILTVILPDAAFAQRVATMGRGAGRPHFVMGGRSIAMLPTGIRSPHLPYQRTAGVQRLRGVARPMHSAFITMNRASNIPSSRTLDGRFRHDRLRRASHFGIPATGFLTLGYGYWPWWGASPAGASDCNGYNENCDEPIADAGAFESGAEDAQRPMITVYLRDGSGYGALDYWVTNGMMHIETTYGLHKSFAMDHVDLVRTGKENAERGVSFTFQSYPMISDPGQVLAPDSYAPPCSEEADSRGSKLAAASSSEKVTEFGATGTATAKGLTLSAVRSGSRAEQVGLRAGDVLVRVDCKTIRSAQDVDMAFAGANRTMWVSYLIQGLWLTDKKVVR